MKKLACPNCGRPVRRASGGEGPASAAKSFSIGEVLSGAYWCEGCGRIAKHAFSREDRNRIRLATVWHVVALLLVLAFGIAGVMLGLKCARMLNQ